MSYTKVTSNNLPREVICPTSKSHANRALILAALKKTAFTLTHLPHAQDVLDMLNMLGQLGLEIRKQGEVTQLLNSFPECEQACDKAVLLAGSEGGTTVRFLLPLLALGKNEYHLPLLGGMKDRPMADLIIILKEWGANISCASGLIKIKGPMTIPSEVLVDCSKTTQFASALELLNMIKDIDVEYANLQGSSKYLQVTSNLVRACKKQDEYEIPADASSLGYLLSYACLTQDLIVSNVTEIDDTQADSFLIKLLMDLGVQIHFTEQGLSIKKYERRLRHFEVDGSTCIDLVPTLMFLASQADGPSKIKNIANLRYKESDRLLEMQKILDFFHVKHKYEEGMGEFMIYPASQLSPSANRFKTASDHRMVMVASLFFKLSGGGEISPSQAVSKSFPDFFDLF